MDDKERIADLERQLAAKPRGGANAFGGGFLGCFGVMAAVAVAVVALVAIGQCSDALPASSDKPKGEVGSDYRDDCAAAVVAADDTYRAARGAEYEIGMDPSILSNGPPVEVSCPYRDRRGRPISINIAVTCGRVMDSGCRIIRSVTDR